MLNLDEWVCTEEDSDYLIERFELRVQGKKPLVIKHPTYSKLLFVTQQYLNCSQEVSKFVLIEAVLNTPEPLTIEEYHRLMEFLEREEN